MDNVVSDEKTRLGLIKQLLSDGIQQHEVLLGVESMDDAALIQISDKESLVVASDFVRGVGFYLFEMGYLNYHDIGYYLVAANISDIAAMGARPIALTTVFRYPQELPDSHFKECIQGMKSAADDMAVQIIGGDIGTYSTDVLAATGIGIVETRRALLRKNVEDGDLLCVTGTVGRAITALIYLKKLKPLGFRFRMADNAEERLLETWRRPVPRTKEGMVLSQSGFGNACQDISDGLKATIEQLSSISGRYFTVFEDQIPIDETTTEIASFLGIDPVQIAVSASNDFELVFTVPHELQKRCSRAFAERGLTYRVIGKVNGTDKNELIRPSGETTELPGIQWKHQADDYLTQIILGASEPIFPTDTD